MMQKFRSKPVVIEAQQITEHTFSEDQVLERLIGVTYDPQHLCVYIDTTEGVMRGNLRDWIIRGTMGELYPCKDEVFQRKYEPVGDDDDGFDRRAAQLGGSPDA